MVLKDSSEFRVPGSGFRTDHAGRPSLLGMEEGIKIRIVRQPTDRSEAEFIARTIESMAGGLRFFSMDSGVASGDSESELGLSDFAVLCRIGRQMDVFEKAFHDHGIPYQKSDTEPFHRKEPVRSVVGALKVAVRSTGSEFRVPGSGLKEADYSELRGMIGRESFRDVVQWIASQMPEAGKPEHRSEIEQLVDLAEPFEKDVLEFLKSLALGAGPDPFRPDIEAAALMTLHAAKGLEFACVFIPGCEDGLLPYRQFERQESDPDEERRLLYVGMTRAKRHLFLSHADKRILYGRELSLPRSPFLDAIEEELVERGTSEYKRRTRKKDSQMDLF
jgi:superfamily I DNA/RNA helicase